LKQLLTSHRTAGYPIARATDEQGREFVILQTAPHKEEAVLAHMLRPMDPAEVRFNTGVLLAEIIAQAQFLGIERDQLAGLFMIELANLPDEKEEEAAPVT
jgi:hypothetical protein